MNEGAAATLLTPSKKKIKNIAIFLKDDDESEDEEKENSLPGKLSTPESSRHSSMVSTSVCYPGRSRVQIPAGARID